MEASFQLTMESLELPKELYWDLKREPPSPTYGIASELFSLCEPTYDEWIYEDNFANGIELVCDEVSLNLIEETSMELLSEEESVVEIFDLKVDECVLDQKAPLTCLDYETNNNQDKIDVVRRQIIPLTKAATTTGPLVAAINYQLGNPSSLIFQQLTPPQSPPEFDASKQPTDLPHPGPVKAEEKAQCFTNDAKTAPADTPFNFNNWVGGNEIDRKNQMIDDIVNMRAQELELTTNWRQFNDDCESQVSSSLESSSGSGVNGSLVDADEEWLPEPLSSSSPICSSVDLPVDSPKKRTRAYGRGVEDRKIRKKEQNKNAATRYRQKKKLEMKHVMGEEQELAQENEGLRRILLERRNEMRYLRQLIREFYQERKR
ncbi:hypothetical protein KR009_010293 [Drosophila setifemur]|nr:hypothetical protein KR009_010293 [Drosophila setifemur]